MTIICGDCLDVMRTFPDNHFSCIVTDPPYGLGFMGKEWDAGLPHNEIWKEALRIVKPGGYILAFGGTRTYHRLTCAIEDAGWEIRDCLMWLYGSGFPKSHDISKCIDKIRNDDVRHVCRFLRIQIEKTGLSVKRIADHFGFHPRMVAHWSATDLDSQPSIPTNSQWLSLKILMGFSDEMDEEVFRLNQRKGTWGECAIQRGVIETTGGLHSGSGNASGLFTGKQLSDNAVSEPAKKFQGFGTALKPAYEPIIIGMKPCDGTFANNAKKWGQSGINIDGCRIEGNWNRSTPHRDDIRGGNFMKDEGKRIEWEPQESHPKGRWPANVILDEEAASCIGESSRFFCIVKKDENESLSRVFYCAKASSRERNEGLEGLPNVECQTGCGGDMPVDDEGKERDRFKKTTKNHHPTVKPLKLMEYLIRLVTPPSNGLLLDPFCGSGSTLIASKRLGLDAIGIEKQPEYCEIARARLKHHSKEPSQLSIFS